MAKRPSIIDGGHHEKAAHHAHTAGGHALHAREHSEEARKAKYQGTVVLWLVVDASGRPQQIRVQRALGMGLDEKAIEAVKQWKFDPARKDGQAVPVMINVEVNFRLY